MFQVAYSIFIFGLVLMLSVMGCSKSSDTRLTKKFPVGIDPSQFGGPYTTEGETEPVQEAPATPALALLAFSGLPAVNLGSTVVGLETRARVSLANFGGAKATGIQLSLIGGAEIRIVQSNCSTEIAPLGVCETEIAFVPSRVGTFSLFIAASYDGGKQAFRALQGEGRELPPPPQPELVELPTLPDGYSWPMGFGARESEAGEVTVYPRLPVGAEPRLAFSPFPEISFGERKLGTSEVRTVLIANFGKAAADITSIGFVGSSVDSFSVVENRCGMRLAGLSVCSVAFAFEPKTVSAHQAFLRIQYANVARSVFSQSLLSLTGRGTSPTLISSGWFHGCGGSSDGLFCWGWNAYSALGLGSVGGELSRPQRLVISGTPSKVIAGHHLGCAIVSGALYCWGFNGQGGVGVGTRDTVSAPSVVAGMSAGVSDVSNWLYHTCAVQEGAVKCWGNNPDGQLGNGGGADALTPTSVAGLEANATAVATGRSHSCAIRSGGLWCWGRNADGQLGLGTTSPPVDRPVLVPEMSSQVTAVAAADHRTCAVKASRLYCWGKGAGHALGNGSPADRSSPTPVGLPLETVSQVAMGDRHGCAIVGVGRLFCWGQNNVGQLGTGRSGTEEPVAIETGGFLVPVQSVKASLDSTCAVSNDRAFCWGRNDHGQLGIGTMGEMTTPQPVNFVP